MKIKENLVLEFNEFSKGYTEKMINVVPHYNNLLHCFSNQLPEDFTPERILDFGCGPGSVSKLLLQKFPNAHFTLLDASNEMITQSKAQFGANNFEFHESYFRDFQFTENQYDLVVASFSMHHCDAEEKQFLFDKVFKSLRQGGILAISDLFIHKQDEDHPQLIEEWRSHVLSNYEDDEIWKWLMQHYDAYDRPDNFKNQNQWLNEVGFSKVSKVWECGHWIHLHALKN